MAKLTAAARKALPASDFAGPNRSYPMPDKTHAVAAKSRAAQFASPTLKAKVDAKANKVIAAAGGQPMPMGGSHPMDMRHNADNRLPQHAMHARGRNRGL